MAEIQMVEHMFPEISVSDSERRRMDLFMYVLYSKDECFVLGMMERVLNEVAEMYKYPDALKLLAFRERPVLFRILFFLLINFHCSFRYWALSPEATRATGLPAICPYKATRFLMALRKELVIKFLVDETMTMEDFERVLKREYHLS